MVGAGSALGAPSDAANVFKSVLARGEIRMIARDDAERVPGVHPGGRGAGAPVPLRHRRRADHRGDAAHPLQPAAAARAQLLGPHAGRSDRDGARDGAALHAAPPPARQGDRLARHRGGARRDRSPVGGEDGGRGRGDLARRADSGGHGLPRRHRSVQGHRGAPAAAASIGQRNAVDAVARRLVLNKGPLKDGFDRPDGVLLFLGPTGVGKTELAKAVAEFLFGDEKKMVRIDMSEYQDGAVSVDKLIGMPRGIVGQRARRHPDQPAEGQPVHRRAARRGREGEPEPAEPVPAGVRRRLADRRPRQARLPERRDR